VGCPSVCLTVANKAIALTWPPNGRRPSYLARPKIGNKIIFGTPFLPAKVALGNAQFPRSLAALGLRCAIALN
jgi:hypothetical protein